MPFLKKAGIHCACIGNHDFDHGDEKLGDLINRCNFPWLLTNVKSAKTNDLFSNSVEYAIIEHEGFKIALIGLAEREWFETLPTIEIEEVIYEDYITSAKKYVKLFKEEMTGIDFLIALTHMRNPRDIKLAQEVPELDLVLGGHDHNTVNFQPNNTLVKKSGSDFREFTLIKLTKFEEDTSKFADFENVVSAETKEFEHRIGVVVKDITKYDRIYQTLVAEFKTVEITSEFERDQELYEHSVALTSELNEKMKVPVCYLGVDLEAAFMKIRTQETNLSNMVADMVNSENQTDVTIINSGTYRIDSTLPAGPMTLQHVMDIFPMLDPIMICKATGAQLHKLLENGVSAYPEFQGKFPSVSGVRFTFDPSKDPYNRIDPKDVFVKGEPLDLAKNYTVSTKQFLFQGKDGYIEFTNCVPLIREDEGIILTDRLLKEFKLLEDHTEGVDITKNCNVVGNPEKLLSPEYEKNGVMIRTIMVMPKTDGRIAPKMSQ